MSVISQVRLKTTEKKWIGVKIGDLCIQDRKTLAPKDIAGQNLPYLGLEHIESQTGNILNNPLKNGKNNDDTSIADNFASGTVSSHTFLFTNRHILYGKLRPYLNKVALPNFMGKCTTELVPLLPKNNISRLYLAWLLRHPQIVEYAVKYSSGSRMPRTNMDKLLNLEVRIPALLKDQENLALSIQSQMNKVNQAKQACREQQALLEELAIAILRDLPFNMDDKNE